MIMRVIVTVMCATPVIMRIIVRMGRVVIVCMGMVRALGVMIARVLRRRRRFGVECVQRAKEGAPFHPKKPGADQHDQCVADGLDDTYGIAHGLGGRADQDRGNRNQHDRGERPQQRGSERQDDAAPPGFFVGDEVRSGGSWGYRSPMAFSMQQVRVTARQ